MIKFFSAFAIASLVLTGGAAAADPQQRFTHDGTTYVFTKTKQGDATVLTGFAQPGDLPFRLSVRDGRVRGHAGGTPVSFRVADSRGASDGATKRSQPTLVAATD